MVEYFIRSNIYRGICKEEFFLADAAPHNKERKRQMTKLMLVRHAESICNKEKIFTGMLDVPLSSNGSEEARVVGTSLREEQIDCVFVSSLIRAKETAAIILQEHYNYHGWRIPLFVRDGAPLDWQRYIPVWEDSRLNERYYGVCEGEKKAEMRMKYGDDAVDSWRREWNAAPDGSESLKDVSSRVRVALEEKVIPMLQEERNVLVVCHQNPLRAFKIIIEEIAPENVSEIEFENGACLQYEYRMGRFVW
ncbi:MAG: histidine phosphatase family protein [Hespellia sp.]|nr:histidine phosphatase family protein [Hespellia sp.]